MVTTIPTETALECAKKFDYKWTLSMITFERQFYAYRALGTQKAVREIVFPGSLEIFEKILVNLTVSEKNNHSERATRKK